MKFAVLALLVGCSSTVGDYRCSVITDGIRWADLTVYAHSLNEANAEVLKVIRDLDPEAPKGEHIISCF